MACTSGTIDPSPEGAKTYQPRAKATRAPASVAVAPGTFFSETLKQAIRDSEQTEYQIAKAACVSQIVISRFLSGERDIRMATADKLADALGLKLGAGA